MTSFIPPKASIWFEIPVTDMSRSQTFYGAVLQNEVRLDETGPNPIAMFVAQDKMASGHFYPGKPAAPGTGPTIHLAVAEPIEEAMERDGEWRQGRLVSNTNSSRPLRLLLGPRRQQFRTICLR